MATKRYRTPNYKGAAQGVANAYEKMADFYMRLYRDDIAFNQQRRREGKSSVPEVAKRARMHKRRANRALLLAKKARTEGNVHGPRRQTKTGYG